MLASHSKACRITTSNRKAIIRFEIAVQMLPFIQANEVKRTEILASGISTN